MLLRVVILASISLAIGVASAAAILKLSKHKGAQSVDNLVITTKGLDDFGVTLELPYEGRSPYHVLLLNNSQYQIIACQIVFEFVTDKGEVRPAHKVVAYSEPLKEQDLVKRKALLTAHPAIAPHTKWLIAMGVEPDLVLVKDQIPPLPVDSQVIEHSKERFTHLVIKLNAVVFENGEVIGPSASEFLKHLRTEVLEEKK